MKYTYCLAFFLPCLLLNRPATAQVQRGDVEIGTSQPAIFEQGLDLFANDRLGGILSLGGEVPLYLLTPSYGYALTNRLLLGTEAVLFISRESASAGAILLPYLRYYPINKETFSFYGEFGRSVSLITDGGEFGPLYRAAVGGQFPLGGNALLTSALQYEIRESSPFGSNLLNLTTGLTLKLGRNNRVDRQSRTYGDAKWAIGLSDVQLSFGKNFATSSSTLSLSYYFSRFFALNYNTSATSAARSDETRELTTLSGDASLGIRGYFSRRGRLHPFLEAAAGITLSYLEGINNRSPEFNVEETEVEFLLLGRLGVEYYLRPDIALITGLSLRRTSEFDGSTDFGLTFGARYYFGPSRLTAVDGN